MNSHKYAPPNQNDGGNDQNGNGKVSYTHKLIPFSPLGLSPNSPAFQGRGDAPIGSVKVMGTACKSTR